MEFYRCKHSIMCFTVLAN
ncbi:hypothetical protein HID58_071670 [Brassica napus]|uniref:Uncharacterized protein n=1 Tax=Brassica napus TaxID=3708 RepID=A0ABQ7Z2A5_BRANA|nr:hypothetical protein HID58_071670 [Brassica napus]